MSGDFPTRVASAEKSLVRDRSQADDMLRWAGIAHWDFVVAEGVLNISADFLETYGYQSADLLPITLEK
jgi:hypothetical protein